MAETDGVRKRVLPENDGSGSRESSVIDEVKELAAEASESASELVHQVWEKTKSWSVVSFEALPDWMKDNEYLKHGHRPPLNSFRKCFGSIFRLHTETMNIWTHLVGSLSFLLLAVLWFIDLFVDSGNKNDFHPSKLPWQEQVAQAFFFCGAVVCMGLSAVFHTLSSHSHNVSKIFSKLDYSGIIFLITGSNITCYYYGFYCMDFARHVYTWLISGFGISSLVVSMGSKFATPKYRVLRTLVFLSLGLFGIVPVCHLIWANGWEAANGHLNITYLLLMAASYISGAAIYAARIPERFFPGKCDLFIHSHTIFHILVIVGCAFTYQSLHTMAWTRFFKNLRNFASGNCMELPLPSEVMP